MNDKPAADQAFQQAQQALHAGRLSEAESHCRAALALHDGHAEAHYLLAILAFHKGQAAQAVLSMRQALLLQADLHDGYFNLGAMLQALGRVAEAEAAYREEIALRPASVRACNNLAALLKSAGRLTEAETMYRQALATDADFFDAQQNLAMLLEDAGRLGEAETLLRRSLVLHPQSSEVCNRLGNVLRAGAKADEAETWYRRAIVHDAGNAMAHNNLGVLLKEAQRWSEAEQAFRRALAAQAQCAEAWQNLGVLLQETGRENEAESCYRRALIEAPDMADAYYNFACLLLQQGKFTQGWREFESRLQIPGNSGGWHLSAPRWDGSASLEGKTIALTAEQGLGDSLQFLRYAPLVAARGAEVILALQAPLKRLAARCAGVAAVYGFGEALPPCDYQCPLMSLPLVFATTPDSIPAAIPYLFPDADVAAQWQVKFDAQRDAHCNLRVGLVWAGNPRKDSPAGQALDRRRSVPFAQLMPLLVIPGAQFFSLQVGEDAASQSRSEPRVIDFSGDLRDFDDTAAMVSQLDLVISVDTAMAHLAGALGKPVWLLNRYDTCWRWMREREDSPWYPRTRIFRQRAPGDWAGVVARVAQALQQELGL